MKVTITLTTLLLIFVLGIVTPQSVKAQWTTQNSSTTEDLYDVFFIDVNKGYVLGINQQTFLFTALQTTNGGLNWNAAPSALLAENPISIFFTDANTGYISSSDKISKTTNGGLTWTPFPLGLGTNVILFNIYFYNSSVGYATALNITTYANFMVHTTDAGVTWIASSGGTSATPGGNSIFCTDANTCYAVGWNGGKGIYKTTNGGTIWTNIFTATSVDFHSVYFTSSTNGIAVGGNNDIQRIYQTTNSGSTWNQVYSSNGGSLTSVCFTDGNKGYVVGSGGLILNTTDGGATWNQMISPTTLGLNNIHFPTATTGYAVGNAGTIIKYSVPTDILENVININDICIYPNPTNGLIKIESFKGFSDKATIEVYDYYGKKIFSRNLENTINQEIDLSQLSKGIYYIGIINNNRNNYQKVVLQ